VLWFSSEQASRAVLTGFAILVMALSLVLTMSRSGIMACAAALRIAGTVTARRQSGASRRTLSVGYLVFLVIAVVSWVGLDQIVARFAQMDPTSINERPAIWADTIGLVAIALQSIAEFSLQLPGNAALFAVVAGLAIHDGRRN